MKWLFSLFLAFSLCFLAIFGLNCVYGFFYPIKYQEEIANASKISGLDETIIYSIINTESRFEKDAQSSKGAVGLMQIMLSTAEEVASAQGLEVVDLKDVQTNITLGSIYLKKMVTIFENLDTAVCAYNAGPNKVKAWLEDKRYSQDGEKLEKIPFEETRGYLQKFKKNYKYYSKKLKKT